jgi:hypothetical protein
MAALRLAELLAGLSLTIDLAGGAPLEKGLRTCAVATALADGLGLDPADQRTVYGMRHYVDTAKHIAAQRGEDTLASA